MYTFEIAVIGGQGGGPFSHADSKELAQAGCWLGAGSNGTRVSAYCKQHQIKQPVNQPVLSAFQKLNPASSAH
jgi:hypothetical protein